MELPACFCRHEPEVGPVLLPGQAQTCCFLGYAPVSSGPLPPELCQCPKCSHSVRIKPRLDALLVDALPLRVLVLPPDVTTLGILAFGLALAPALLARVLDVDGQAIPGLYAAGNVMASPMGMTYGGAGGTLGPGMVFGYRAGRDAGQRFATSTTREEQTA